MAFIRQKGRLDCGIAVLAMLCNVTYEEADKAIPWRREGNVHGASTTMLRVGGHMLGYWTESTPQDRLKVVRAPKSWADLPLPMVSDFWALVPDNSLVKVAGGEGLWHWVAWRKGRVYDPARGVFTPGKYSKKPTAYMKFMKKEIVHV